MFTMEEEHNKWLHLVKEYNLEEIPSATGRGTITGNLVLGGTLQVASYSTSNLPAAGTSGTVIFVSDGDNGSPCNNT